MPRRPARPEFASAHSTAAARWASPTFSRSSPHLDLEGATGRTQAYVAQAVFCPGKLMPGNLTKDVHGWLALMVAALCAAGLLGWLLNVEMLTTFAAGRPRLTPMTG